MSNFDLPVDIEARIIELNKLVDEARIYYNEVIEWYNNELKSYNANADSDDELFDAKTGDALYKIDRLAILESISELQTAAEIE
jgi:hypothetical protein